jgi:putative ABC transport system substrate-binding protein
MTNGRDPVGTGLVASLARPGGNVTGLSTSDVELSGKRLELLRETAPAISRVALLWNPINAGHRSSLQETEAAARVLGVQLVALEVHDQGDVDGLFEAAAREGAEALIALRTPLTLDHAGDLASRAVKRGLATMGEDRRLVEAGGLMAYGQDQAQMYRRAADYVAKILRGTQPADLPVELPREFDLVINLSTAQALGLTIPRHVLLQATEVLQ